ncbi:hypothetical protein [Asanoa siamensis]|uniref:Uncharacterized protein n=1 Tax=Asanoa siamensis TaxID=926357 RepID=A0ABQ4CWK1_9ACTN|nr:hypothetical protein [Asanoa siamensis]GIF75640.1 hypothetical protein Asi02nite_51580 [Asanoa siamensis]
MAMREAGERPRAVQQLLTDQAGVRRRVVDDHMFAFNRDGYPPATFRLQMFAAAGQRPVAIATQTMSEGASLINRAERYVEEVWRTHCADEPEPPIWIQHQLLSPDDHDTFQHVTFTVTGPYSVDSAPHWDAVLTGAELAELVGGPVDADRGAGFVPRTPDPEPRLRYATAIVAFLPRPDLDDDSSPCMRTGLGLRTRVSRQLRPHRAGRGCCWYHGGDWHEVSAAAIAMVAAAHRHGVDVDDVAAYVLGQAAAQGLSGWKAEALESLFIEPMEPNPEVGYVNGRHRAKAMIDAGVRRALVIRYDDQQPAPSGQ